MTWFGNTISNGYGTVAQISTDAFARLRVSHPTTLFDMQNQYSASPLLFENIVAGTGAITHLPNEASIQLSTGGTASGALAARQSRQYFRYHPGKSQLVLMTRTIGAKKTNVRQRWGYFDAQNGLFFEQDATNLKVVSRSYTSGSVVDTTVNQSAWNVDKLDGTGASGITIDTSKMNLYFIQLQWLGTGNQAFGIFHNGIPVVCHAFQSSNALTVPYMTTANLPLRNEIENTGTAASLTTMKATCNAVISEGGTELGFAYDFGVGNGITSIGVTTRRAILSIRPKATFNGIVNRGNIAEQGIDLITKTNDAYWEVVYNPTFTTGAGALTWTSVDTNSITEYCVHGDANAGAITNGIVIDSGFIAAGSGSTRAAMAIDVSARYPMTLDSAGANPIALSLVLTAFAGTSTANGAFSWSEEY